MKKALAAILLAGVVFCPDAVAIPRFDPHDPIDRTFGVREALERVERACICHEGDGEADRRRTVRLLCELDRCRTGAGKYVNLEGWITKGIDGGERGVQFACAKLFRLAGVLYGYHEFEVTGQMQEAKLLANGPETQFRDVAALPPAVRSYYALMADSREDMSHEIRPGGRDGSPFWNGRARLFIYPPSFDFKRVEGATRYRFTAFDDMHAAHSFTSAEPTASLSSIWSQIPVGPVTVTCVALAADGKEKGIAGRRTFWRSVPFDPAQYAPAKRSYRDACKLALDYLFRWPDLAYLEAHGEPDLSKETNFTSYPSKMQSAVIHMMLQIAKNFPDRREQALRMARISANYLLSTRAPDSSPLAGFTATYASKGQRASDFGGQHMLIYPAHSGSAFLALHEVTKDSDLLDAARKIAQTYLRLQDKDGTWYLKMNEKDGSPVSSNRLVPTCVISFLEELYSATGDTQYRIAADRAFAFIDRGPLTDWNWEGQFEDINPAAHRYQNLTKHNACETAIYLVKRFPGDRRRLEQARDIMRYAEDQFVTWRAPCRDDGTGPWRPTYPFRSWRTPAVLEQYSCYSPIDASAAKLIRTYLALYEAEGKPLDLAKARALGDSTVNNQNASGRIRTYWIPEAGDDDPLAGAIRLPHGGDWYNCMAADVTALSLLAEFPTACAAFSKIEADVSALSPEMRLVGDLLRSRVTERTPESPKAGTLRVRYAIDASIPDDYACVKVSAGDGTAEIRAPRMRGLVVGTGNLLKSLRYGKDTFVATDGTFDFRPAKSFREAYLARHFMNYFMEAPAEELCRQVDDLVLDGINSFSFQFAVPTVDKARVSAEEAVRFVDASRKMNARVAELDCDFSAGGGGNQLPANSPEEFRAEPNTDPKRPSTGFNACPAKPKALQALLDQQRRALKMYKDVKRISIFGHWPYDEGGCGCKTCSPWGGNGYLKLIEKFHAMNDAAFPGAKTRISTWFFDDADFEGLWKFLETHNWVDYVLVDDFGDKYPEYPLKHPIPGKAKIITFPEISMWGRVPWGGYGAIATPRLMESMFRQAEPVAGGFTYYSEGRFEDINKAIVIGLYINPKTTTDDILRQYAAYHFAGADPEDFVKLGNLLDTNHRPHLMRLANVEKALAIARKMDGEMLPQLARDWRWRQVYLRTLIDREIVVRGNFEPESAHPYFDELVKIYRAERQLRWVLDGKMGGWTCPKYVPRGAAKVYDPPSGDATGWLQGKIGDKNLVTVRLGRGDWHLGDVAINRSRFELVLEDGCRLVPVTPGPAALRIGKRVDGVTVRGEGRALIEMPVVVEQATNVVVRNVIVPDGDVRLVRSESVALDLAPSARDEPAANAADELTRIDKILEWVHQHAEYEKVERLYEKEKALKAVLEN